MQRKSNLAENILTTPKELWERTSEVLKETINPRSYQTWFAPIQPLDLTDSTIILGVPNKFFQEWIDNHYTKILKNALIQTSGYSLSVQFKVLDNKPFSAYTDNIINDIEIKHTPASDRDFSSSNLNSNYTFDNFIIGDGNKFAQAAAWAVSESPGNTNYNPLIIYGGTGLGKTHLIQAIGNNVLRRSNNLKVYYASSESFTSHFITSIQQNNVIEFSNFYRSCDLLMIDDIQFFSNKGKTQEEFFHTFNALHQNKKQIVLTSDRPVNELSFLEERLISRFKWGLVADIQPPDLETRIAILQSKCEENNLQIPNDIIDYLAVNLTHNIRELEGALTRLMAQVLLTHTEPTLELAQKVVTEIGQPISKGITIDQIIQLTSKAFDVPQESFMKKSRTKDIAFARQVAMYLSKELSKFSTTTIGLHFGGRDHSTVIYAYKVIEGQIKIDAILRNKIEEIKRMLQYSR
ncbi:MAG: chromosomal replication initiator protein DnaA [Calditrichia bacterium]|nr:chromosomal replication initiator protein DnaA [Calditrichia bacterium]